MAVKVMRVFSERADSLNDLEYYSFSIIATEGGAEYVFPPGREVSGLDADRIAKNEERLSAKGDDAESPEDWIEAAGLNIRGVFLEPEEEYTSLSDARAGENAYAVEAGEFINDFESLDNDEDELFVEESEEQVESANELLDDLYSYYALASDEGDVVAAFRVKDGVEEMRTSYGWGGQSFEQDEEWDGYSQITMDKEFIPFFDDMVSENKDITLDDVKKFRREES